MFCELQWRWNKFESKLCPLLSFTISEKWQHRSNCKDIFFTLPTRLSWRFEAKIQTSIWFFVRHCYWLEIIRFVIVANLSMPSLTEAHHLWQEYMIWSRAQGLLDSKNKISVPLWLLLLLNRLAEKSEQTPELNKTGSNHFLKADSAYASDQGSVQGALEASLWQVARWPLCTFYFNFQLCSTSALLDNFFL